MRKCQRCGNWVTSLIGLGGAFSSDNEPLLRVCPKCRADWVAFLHKHLKPKSNSIPSYDEQGKVWLKIFNLWLKGEKVKVILI
jgi:hypothetical protein